MPGRALDQFDHVLLAEASEIDPLDALLAAQRGHEIGEWMARGEIRGPVNRDDEQP